mmetsp:Transcript_17407/g.35558  ORF Transcript_17407/g.35558 Transcript_17407/m.35558 type:complete len:286 (+) Transcript_17407:400-1257(+)
MVRAPLHPVRAPVQERGVSQARRQSGLLLRLGAHFVPLWELRLGLEWHFEAVQKVGLGRHHLPDRVLHFVRHVFHLLGRHRLREKLHVRELFLGAPLVRRVLLFLALARARVLGVGAVALELVRRGENAAADAREPGVRGDASGVGEAGDGGEALPPGQAGVQLPGGAVPVLELPAHLPKRVAPLHHLQRARRLVNSGERDAEPFAGERGDGGGSVRGAEASRVGREAQVGEILPHLQRPPEGPGTRVAGQARDVLPRLRELPHQGARVGGRKSSHVDAQVQRVH